MRIIVIALLLGLLWSCQTNQDTLAMIETDYGDMKIKLYQSTPLHYANFMKLIEDDYYDGMLFHRVMPDFMIQGGDPGSKTAKPGERLGGGGPGYTIPAEIGAPHFRGALSAARQADEYNPQKESSGSQFFVVQGTPQTDGNLNIIEREKGIKYTEAQRQLYREMGGYPSLDKEYTVFGEVVEGFDIIDKIISVKRDAWNRPVENIRIVDIRILD